MANVVTSVQFRGTANVVKAFENLGVPRWAVFQKNNLNEKYEGNDLTEGVETLQQFLSLLERSQTNAIYTLKTYEDLPENKIIKPSTECDRSFNFQLWENERFESPYSQYKNRQLDEITQRLDRMEALAVADNDNEHETEGEAVGGFGLMGYLNKLLENPVVQQKLGAVIGTWIDKIMPAAEPQQSYPVAINGVQPDANDQVQKIQAAIDVLFSVDPLLGDHLEHLAKVAKNNPGKYNNLISMLNLL